MINNVKEGAQRMGEAAKRFSVSRLLVPAVAGLGTFVGAHDVAHLNTIDSLELAVPAGLFASSLAEMGYNKGKPSYFTLPLLAGLAAEAGLVYTHHNEFMTQAYPVATGGTLALEAVGAGLFSRKSSSRRG